MNYKKCIKYLCNNVTTCEQRADWEVFKANGDSVGVFCRKCADRELRKLKNDNTNPVQKL